jgi:transposase-like protein
MRNLLTRVPKTSQGLVATLVRTIFEQPDAEQVAAQHARVVEQLTDRFPDAVELLIDAAGDLLAFTAFPREHWRQIWSNNPQERLNKELRRRTDVVGIFPNRAAVVRLVGAVLAEQHDEWAVARRYMSVESLAKGRLRPHRHHRPGRDRTDHHHRPRQRQLEQQPTVDAVVVTHHVPGLDPAAHRAPNPFPPQRILP